MSSSSPIVSAPEHSHRQRDPWWKSARLATYATLAIALVAVAVAVAAWLRPASGSASYSDQQSAQARKNVCSAAKVVDQAVFAKYTNPHPGDPIGEMSVAANARLALMGGGAYLRETVAAEPATSADLAKAANSMANTVEQIGINQLARTANPAVLNPLKQQLANEISQINKLCAPNGSK
jgi:hypothetical protein